MLQCSCLRFPLSVDVVYTSSPRHRCSASSYRYVFRKLWSVLREHQASGKTDSCVIIKCLVNSQANQVKYEGPALPWFAARPDQIPPGLPACSPGLDSTHLQSDTKRRKLDRMSGEESLGWTLLPNTTKSLSILSFYKHDKIPPTRGLLEEWMAPMALPMPLWRIALVQIVGTGHQSNGVGSLQKGPHPVCCNGCFIQFIAYIRWHNNCWVTL